MARKLFSFALPRSLFTVNEVNEVETKLAIPIGKAAFRVDPERRLKRRFEVRTVTAVIGVRGTDFVMGVGMVKLVC